MKRTKLRHHVCKRVSRSSEPVFPKVSNVQCSPFQGLDKSLGVPVDFEYLDSAVARARCKATSIIIEDGIVLVRRADY